MIRLVIFLIILTLAVFAGGNNVSDMLDKLDDINPEVRQSLIDKSSDDSREFKEYYKLTANFRLFNLQIGRMEIGEVIISNQDSFSISYDPPFDKWDTQYLSYWLNDSVFVDEVISREPEKFIYRKSDSFWTFCAYEAENPRELKLAILHSGLKTDALNLIEFIRILYQRRFSELHKVLFLAETYPIRLEESPVLSDTYSVYDLKWNVHEGEERIRIHGVYLAGLETDIHFIPLGGILKMSFVGLLDVDLIGIINH